MSNDLYTKGVLTVITCCLLYLCFVNHPQIVHADPQQHVWIDGASPDAFVPTLIAGVLNNPSQPSFAIPIRSADQLPVSIMNIGGQNLPSWGAMPVMNTNGSDMKVLPLTVTVK